MREIISSHAKGKRIIACIDHDEGRGGLTLEQIRTQLVEAEGSYDKWQSEPRTQCPVPTAPRALRAQRTADIAAHGACCRWQFAPNTPFITAMKLRR